MSYVGAGTESIQPLIGKLRQGETDRWLLRKLQRYTVSVRRKLLDTWQAQGDVKELVPGMYLLIDELRYDDRLGLLPDSRLIDPASLVA